MQLYFRDTQSCCILAYNIQHCAVVHYYCHRWASCACWPVRGCIAARWPTATWPATRSVALRSQAGRSREYPRLSGLLWTLDRTCCARAMGLESGWDVSTAPVIIKKENVKMSSSQNATKCSEQFYESSQKKRVFPPPRKEWENPMQWHIPAGRIPWDLMTFFFTDDSSMFLLDLSILWWSC
jgi:hypothetical protein